MVKKNNGDLTEVEGMSQPTLPMELPPVGEPAACAPTGRDQARICRAVRNQVEMMARDLDSMVSEAHPVRAIWAFLEGMDLSAFYGSIKAALDGPGRPASDPEVLLALWIYATVEGIGSARRLDTLCREHDAYRWLRGGVPVDYHILSDFRVAHREALDELLTNIVATLEAQNLVTLKQVAQDGVRVRASAGGGSFRRQRGLEECLSRAEEQVRRLAEEREHSDPEVTRRERVARERAAKERLERVEKALRQLPEVQAVKERHRRTRAKAERGKITEARVSTTDPAARVMKMPDGGYRPAYNVQLATDVDSRVIVGVAVINQGTDARQGEVMEAQVARRSGVHPEAYLVDGGYAQLETVSIMDGRGVSVYAPVQPPRSTARGRDWTTPRKDDRPPVAKWRQRMGTEDAKAIYKMRGATAEWSNAQVRGHGLLPFTVRGLDKVFGVALLVAISHNILRVLSMGM